MSENIYYTYAWLREDGTPYYIGKGKEGRAWAKRGNRVPPPDDRVLILKQNLSEENAYKHEIYMIAIFGRKDIGSGILYNFTDGGDGVRGHRHSEETKLKLAELARNQTPYVRTEETRRKLSESLKKRPPHSAERRKKISESLTGKVQSEETKEKRAAKLRGRTRPEEVKRKISETKRRKRREREQQANH